MTPEDFDELIAWLGTDRTGVSDRNRGVIKYEQIRCRIIKIYRNRGSHYAEEIADETADRLCKKAKELRRTYEGDPALYFYAVAKKVYLEFLKDSARALPPPPPPQDDSTEIERRYACLDECLEGLKPESKELILRFYEGEKGEKIENRKKLARQLGIDNKALNLRALRIRRELLECIRICLGA
ncbi:MAG: sigma-70 family RNA polymerase sigma factor [Acidobacteria bacterium]|nr:sigma-70 family RNA polymerase sigma factor [Acidobacteriota bacterium]